MLSGLRQSNVKNAVYLDLYIHKFSIIGSSEYSLDHAYYYSDNNQPFHSYIRCKAKSPSTGEWKNFGSFSNSGKITITRFDSNGCSGLFFGDLKEENGSEIIKISDGRFDINYSTLWKTLTKKIWVGLPKVYVYQNNPDDYAHAYLASADPYSKKITGYNMKVEMVKKPLKWLITTDNLILKISFTIPTEVCNIVARIIPNLQRN